MISNASLEKIGTLLSAAQSIIIFPHLNVDGDALGSSSALCRALRNMGKEAWILLEEDVPNYISFIDTEFCTQDHNCVQDPDVCICVDCSEESRFPQRVEKYNSGKVKLCVDHHATSGEFGDYYYIDGDEAATAQLIYKLLVAMNVEITSDMARSLYTGINTDTGSFRYSNANPQTHMITAELLKTGFDHVEVNVALYQNVSLKKIKLENKILDKMEIFADGKGVISYVTDEMVADAGADMEDAEGAIDTMRNIEGVEIAAFIKDRGEAVKVSMRAKSYGRVDGIAQKYNGGGHAKAAGCTLKMSVAEAKEIIKKEIATYLEN